MAPRRDTERTRVIRNKIKKWDDDWRFNKDQYHEFMSFVMGSQWTEDESKLFVDYKKIPLSFNKLAPLVNHVLGVQRQNTPSIQVEPDDEVPPATVEVRQALVRNICLSSNAKVKFQNAFQQAAIGGFGACMLDTDYENNRSFKQVIEIKDIKDPTWCYWDVSAKSENKIDGMCAGYRIRMSRKMFAGIFGKEIEAAIGADANYDEGSATGWIFSNDNEITLIYHYEREYDTEMLYQLSNGRTVTKKELKEFQEVEIEGMKGKLLFDGFDVLSIVNQREVPKYKIKHELCAGEFILEETYFPGESLPIVFVDQNSYIDKSGKQICRPLIKDARDAQRYINYLGTQSAYLMRVSRYDQFMVSKANVKSTDTQTIWRDPMTAQGALVYDESPNGNKPEQLRPPELSPSLITQYQRALNDIESCTGIYGTQMGEQGNETSAKAIDARTKRGSYNTFVPFDAINRAVACVASIINEMIPHVYDTERTMTLDMPDTGMREVTINQQQDMYGSDILHDMRTGHYRVRLAAGASFEGQKQENLESIQTVLQADPSLFRLVADLYVENLPNMPNNIELRNRLRTIVPPEIIEAGKTGKPIPPKPPEMPIEVQIKMMELQMKQQESQMHFAAKMREIEAKEHSIQLEGIRTGQDIAAQMEKLKAEKLEAAAKLQEQELRYEAEMQRTTADIHIAHADNIVKLLTSQPHKEIRND